MLCHIRNRGMDLTHRLWMMVFIVAVLMTMANYSCSDVTQSKAKLFSAPGQAVEVLVDAVKHDDTEALLTIFGPEGEELLYSGDEIADRAERACFLDKFEEMNTLEQKTPHKVILVLGKDKWPFPVPIVKEGARWYFDVSAGKEEILNRRIGRNELDVLKVMNAYVDAQREYISKDHNDDGVLEFAQKIRSDEGTKDGLYWPVKEGEEMSPFGPLVAETVKEGYKELTPYHGYYYKILKSQGTHAPGGKYDYTVNGHMLLGFAAVAYPAKYGASGIMTFMVNQQGVVYEKDLCEDTATIVDTMTTYDPDETWDKVENMSHD